MAAMDATYALQKSADHRGGRARDDRGGAIVQGGLGGILNGGPKVHALTALSERLNGGPSAVAQAQMARMLNARPVQRRKINDDETLDTENSEHEAEIIRHLDSLGVAQLEAELQHLDAEYRANTGRFKINRKYIENIKNRIASAKLVQDISDHKGRGPGIFVKIQIFANGAAIGATKIHRGGQSSVDPEYGMVTPHSHPTHEASQPQLRKLKGVDIDPSQHGLHAATAQNLEQQLSKKDAEVDALQEADAIITGFLEAISDEDPVKLNVIMAGTAGACDGCKERMHHFADNIVKKLPPNSSLRIENSYADTTYDTVRGNDDTVLTSYGFPDQQSYGPPSHKYYNIKRDFQSAPLSIHEKGKLKKKLARERLRAAKAEQRRIEQEEREAKEREEEARLQAEEEERLKQQQEDEQRRIARREKQKVEQEAAAKRKEEKRRKQQEERAAANQRNQPDQAPPLPLNEQQQPQAAGQAGWGARLWSALAYLNPMNWG